MTHLNLAYNYIQNFPEQICEVFYQLQDLRLNNNELTQIPWTIYKLRQLKILYLHCNYIESIPHTIAEIDFDELSIAGNPTDNEFGKFHDFDDLHYYIKTKPLPEKDLPAIRKAYEREELSHLSKDQKLFLLFLEDVEYCSMFLFLSFVCFFPEIFLINKIFIFRLF